MVIGIFREAAIGLPTTLNKLETVVRWVLGAEQIRVENKGGVLLEGPCGKHAQVPRVVDDMKHSPLFAAVVALTGL